MYDQELLKEKYGIDADDFCSWDKYLQVKVKTIRKNNLEAVKVNYGNYGIYDIYSFNGDCKFDVVILKGYDGFPQVIVNHSKKVVSPIHGYAGRGKQLAERLGYEYQDI